MMKQHDSDYIWESIMELINLDEHIDFAARLVNKYQWDKQTKKELEQILSLIKSKQMDKCINISVVGEISSGKSSFVNAILKEELLVSSTLQGTTLANTVIEYDEHLSLTIVNNNGSKKRHEYRQIKDLRDRLSNLTTNPKQAKKNAFVYVGIPSPFLKRGIRIIDTPGTNSVESWHEEVTKKALRELSDLTIILTEATRALPKTLNSFLNENMSSLFRQCALAVTKIDLVKEEEREQAMAYIKKRALSELEIDDILTLPFSAQAVIGELTGTKLVENQQQQLAEMFETNAQRMARHSVEMRKTAQVKKLLFLVNEVYDSLKSSMVVKNQQCDDELAMLEKSRKAPLENFINRHKKKQKTEFSLETLKIRNELVDHLEPQLEASKKTLLDGIKKTHFENAEQLINYLKKDFSNLCMRENLKLNGIILSATQKLKDQLTHAIKQFQKDFMAEFQRLGLLQLNMEDQELPRMHFSIVLSSFLDDIVKSVSDSSKENDSLENNGARGGMIIGFALGGPLGAAIGGGVGYLLARFLGQNVSDMKKEVEKKLSEQLEGLDQAKEEAIKAFDQASEEIYTIYDGELDRYLLTYRSAVDKQIRQNKVRQDELNKEKREIKNDLRLIDTHKVQLMSVISKINQK